MARPNRWASKPCLILITAELKPQLYQGRLETLAKQGEAASQAQAAAQQVIDQANAALGGFSSVAEIAAKAADIEGRARDLDEQAARIAARASEVSSIERAIAAREAALVAAETNMAARLAKLRAIAGEQQ